MDLNLLESIGLGLGLGVAAGFRVVVPFWVLSVAAVVGAAGYYAWFIDPPKS